MCDDDTIASTFATFSQNTKRKPRNGRVHAHLQVDQIFQQRLSGHYCRPFSNLPQPIMQLSGVVNWSWPPLKCVKHSHHPQRGLFSQTLEPRKTSSSCFFFFSRQNSAVHRVLRDRCSTSRQISEQTTESAANLYHSSVYKGTKVAHNSANYD